MHFLASGMILVFGVLATVLTAADLEGQIIVKRKLTRRTVTAPVPAYHRGAVVQPPPVQDEDPLAFERQRVVIYLEGEAPSEPVTAAIEQVNRRFVPDLLVVPAGSTVSFPNRDAIFHNVFSLSKPKVFDLGTYPKDQTRLITLYRPGVMYVNCHLHPNMSAAIVVTPNRWNARPDASGNFRLADIPAGKHTVVAWHRAAGFFRQTVNIEAGKNQNVSFLIPFEDDGTMSASAQR